MCTFKYYLTYDNGQNFYINIMQLFECYKSSNCVKTTVLTCMNIVSNEVNVLRY